MQCLWTLPPNLPVPHPWEIRLRLLEIVHVAGRWYWFCYAPFLFICPLVYEPFIEWTVSFHISMLCSGMLWIQDSSELPVSPGWTAWRWSTVHAGVLPTPPAASRELKDKEILVVAKVSHFQWFQQNKQHEDEHGDEKKPVLSTQAHMPTCY